MSSSKPLDMQQLKTPKFIPGSIFFDFNSDICDHNSHLSNMMPPIEQFKRQVEALGLNSHDTVYVYDDFGNFCSSRVWFMFKTIGFNRISVIDGGLPKWLDLNYPTQVTLKTPAAHGVFDISISEKYKFVNADYVLEKTIAHDTYILDARGTERFLGKVKEKREGLRVGHIPSSSNIPYTILQTRKGMQSTDAIKEAFGPFMDASELIFSCGSGVTACILAQCFDAINTNNSVICVYDGSWSEWAADSRYPVEQNL